jgi:hypothetical protein
MAWKDLLIDGYGRVDQVLKKTLDGLTEDDLNRQPHPDCNSMGWLTWHLARVQDSHVAALLDENQLWVRDDWYAKFNRAAEPGDTGYGHTPQDLAKFKSPDVQTLMGYYHAVLELTKGYIASLSGADLDRELNEPWYQPLPTVGVRLVSVMADNLQHVGQVGYLRGLLESQGQLDV